MPYKRNNADAPNGWRITASRLAAGLSPKGLADVLGISEKEVLEWECGKSWLGNRASHKNLKARILRMMEKFPPTIEDMEIDEIWQKRILS